MLALLLATGCQPISPTAPASSPSPFLESTAPPSEAATPYPPMETAPSYPPPELFANPPVVEQQIVGIYPGPTTRDASMVDWQTAETAILSGEVTEIYQDNYLHVTLILNNGEVLVTLQPALDEVSKILERCGDLDRK